MKGDTKRPDSAVAASGNGGLSDRHMTPLEEIHASQRAALNLMEDAVDAREQVERAVAELRESEERQAFLLKLVDALRPLDDPEEVKTVAGRVLGEQLRANRVLYCEVREDDWIVGPGYECGVAPIRQGPHSAGTCGEWIMDAYRSGKRIVFTDTRSDPRFAPPEREAHAAVDVIAAVGIPLLRDGTLAAIFVVHLAQPHYWNEAEIALVEEAAQRTWAAVERARTEDALRRSEEKYRTLFESIDEGFTTIRVIFDDANRPVDYRFIDVNPAFERQSGMVNAEGRRMREIAPDHEQDWFDIYGKVALTGEPVRFEHWAEQLNRFFDVYAFRVGLPAERKVGVLFTDITDRKRREHNLAFLAEVSQDLTQIASAEELVQVLCEKIGRHFGVSRCNFADIDTVAKSATITHDWHVDALPDLPAERVYGLDEFITPEFHESIRVGELIAVGDTVSDPRTRSNAYSDIHTRSFVASPYLRNGEWKAMISISDPTPRDWRQDEIELMRELTTRIWIRLERARAEKALRESQASLRASEEKFRTLSEAAPALIWYDDANGDCVYVNERYVEFSGRSPEELAGSGWKLVLHPADADAYLGEFRDALREQRAFRARVRAQRYDGEWRWIESHARPIFGRDRTFIGHVGMSPDITDTVDAEDRLRESRELFFGLIENAPFGVYLVDSDFRLAQVSAASQKVFENVEPLIGRDFGEVLRSIWKEPFATQAIERFHHTLETGEEYHAEETVENRADIHGMEAYDWMLKRITLPDGKYGVVCYFFDLSERRRAEAALRESQERFEAAQRAGNIGVWDWDATTDETYWSETMWTIYGYERPEDSADTRWEKSLHPDDISALSKVSALLASEETSYRDEFRILRPDGSVRWLESVARVTRDENGRATRMSGVNLDITDRKRAERALQESEERLRLLTQSFQDFAIFTTDLAGNVVTWNPGAQNIFGYRQNEIVGRHSRLLFVPEDQTTGEAEHEMETARTKGRAADERWHLRKDGSRFYASGIMAPIFEAGALIGYAKIARDLTSQKQAEEELQRQHEKLESIVAGRTMQLAEANKALVRQMEERRLIEEERFALMQKIVTTQEDERRRIARDMHDSLGQQMTALRLKIASMKNDHPTDEGLLKNLERLQELGARVDEEVNFLVWELRPTVLDDLGLVSAIENYIREWSRHYGIPAEFHAARFRNGRLDGTVETNLYRISQEALNNIYKHARAKSVNVVLEARRKEIVLVIEDDGVGFDPDTVGPDSQSGRGLGLVGMRERAAIVGGKVELESAVGRGTTVFVSVPH